MSDQISDKIIFCFCQKIEQWNTNQIVSYLIPFMKIFLKNNFLGINYFEIQIK